jgi:hypothetical protein
MKIYIGPYLGKRSKRKERKISVRIDEYDVWSFDHTLALIILPGLKLLKERKHGAPLVDDVDVPEKLRVVNAKRKGNGDTTDSNYFKRWDWVLNELIWTFNTMALNEWVHPISKYKQIDDRINNGLKLFGKYFRSLWD